MAATVYIYLEAHATLWTNKLRRNFVKTGIDARKKEHQAIEGWRTIVYFNRIGHESARYADAVVKEQDAWLGYSNWIYGLRILTESPGVLAFSISVLLIAVMISNASLSVGAFVTFTSYWGGLWYPIVNLTHNFQRHVSASLGYEGL